MQITLRAARVNAGLRQIDAAEAINISKATLISWEAGKTSPKAWQMQQLCELYGIPIDHIFFPSNPQPITSEGR